MGMIVLLFITPQGNRLVWTVAIALVPITLLVIGYSRWRIICPLAWFSKITQNINFSSKRKIPDWFENNLYLVQLTVLFLALSSRHYILNNDALMLGGFFILVIIMAMLSGVFLSGKSWCNFLCPVGVVEKIYAGSNAHMYHVDSACDSCTTCKKNCPDIDMEKSYWNETLDKQKRFVFYAFPGLVFGFYFYYFLEIGTWDYYFNGTWAFSYESRTLTSALFMPGFYFLPQIPKLVAVPLTLVLVMLVSFYLFILCEKFIKYATRNNQKDIKAVEHITKIFSAFIGFNIFYLFAGAPTFSHYPYWYASFHFIVVVFSVVFLWKEIHREEKYFKQERFALNILKKWTSSDIPSKNLKEVYYTYANKKRDHAQYLENYKETIFELLSDGILSTEDMKLLDKMQIQLGITSREHKAIINSLAKEHAEFFDENSTMTTEKFFQLKSYKSMLKRTLDENKMLNDSELEQIRKHFHVEIIEHEKILNELVNSEGILKEKVFVVIVELVSLYKINSCVPKNYSIAADYFKLNIEHEIVLKLQHLEKILLLLCKSEDIFKLMTIFQSNSLALVDTNCIDEEFRPILKELFLYKNNGSSTIARFREAAFFTIKHEFKSLYPSLHFLLVTENIDNSYDSEVNMLIVGDHVLGSKESLNTIEKEALLHAVPLFYTLSPEYIEMIAQSVHVKSFVKGDYIVRQGEEGNALYILLKGSASIFIETSEGQKKVSGVVKNDCIGEVALFSGEKYAASVCADEDVDTLKLSYDTLKEVINYCPNISLAMMRQMTLSFAEKKAEV